jgi:hypothetical protein
MILGALFVIFVVWPIYAMLYEPAEMQKLGSRLQSKGHRHRDDGDTYFERMKKR